MNNSIFDSFSGFINSAGQAIGNVTTQIGNFLGQRQAIKSQQAAADAKLALLRAQLKQVNAQQVRPTQQNNAQKAAARNTPTSDTIAGFKVNNLLLIGAAIMVFKVLK